MKERGRLTTASAGESWAGVAYADEDLSPGYCMAKIPLIGAIVLLVTVGEVSLESPIRRYINIPYLDPSLTVVEVLEHRAGLVAPDLVTWRMTTRSERAGRIPRWPLPPNFAYSDLLVNMVMVELIEAVVGTTALEFIRTRILSPAGAMNLVKYGVDNPDVNPAVAGLPHATVPLASERLADQVADVTPATGVFASAKGLALVLDWLFVSGDEADRRLDTVLARQAQAVWDPVLCRPASYAVGFMSSLELHGLSTRAFGHTAAMAAWLAVVDPEASSVYVGYCNGVPVDEQDAWQSRNSVLAALRSDCDRLSSPAAVVRPTAVLGEVLRDPVLQGLLGSPDVLPSLPVGCALTVELDFTDTGQRAILLFADGSVTSVHHPAEGTHADVTLRAARVVFARWLSDPDARLGGLIQAGDVVPAGRLWYLSALEYWAACRG